MIGAVQLVTRRGTFFMTIGSRKTVPSRILRMVPLGLFHIMFEVEFLHPGLIGGDGSAFDAYSVLLDGVGGVDGHLVVCLVPVFDTKVKIFDVDFQVGKDQFVLDKFPDNSGHFITVQFDNGICYFDFLGHFASVFTFKRIANVQEMKEKPMAFLYVCVPKLGGAQFALFDRKGEKC